MNYKYCFSSVPIFSQVTVLFKCFRFPEMIDGTCKMSIQPGEKPDFPKHSTAIQYSILHQFLGLACNYGIFQC